jgi:hypothetical protein
MKSIRGLALGVAALAACGVAVAQDQTINEYVVSLIEDLAVSGAETLVDEIELTELYAGDSDEFYFEIDPDITYTVYGACDDDCANVDLVAYDDDGEIVASDEEDDDMPILNIFPGDAGEGLHIEVVMVDCETDVCVAGVGVYASDE